MNKRKILTKLAPDQEGNALFMTLLIFSGIMVSVLGVSELIMSSIRMGNIQTQSTKAYFAAEAGAERVLWKYESDEDFRDSLGTTSREEIFGGKTLSNGSSYEVDYDHSSTTDSTFDYKYFTTVGDFQDVRRTVETSLKYPK